MIKFIVSRKIYINFNLGYPHHLIILMLNPKIKLVSNLAKYAASLALRPATQVRKTLHMRQPPHFCFSEESKAEKMEFKA